MNISVPPSITQAFSLQREKRTNPALGNDDFCHRQCPPLAEDSGGGKGLWQLLPKSPTSLWLSIFYLLLIFSIGCQEQELPEEIVGDPVFFVEGEIDGSELNIVAGESGYYMESDHWKDEQDVFVFSGTFSPLNCSDCPETLEVQFRDHRLREIGESIDLDSIFQIGPYAYAQDENSDGSSAFRVSFTSESSDSGANSYDWDFGDGSSSEEENPIHLYTDTSLSIVNVCLDGVDPSGCTTQICNDVLLTEVPCIADFKHERFPNSTYVSFMQEVRGLEPIQYRWDFGDGYGATLGNPGYYYEQEDLYTVCLEITDATGCKSEICKNIAVDPDRCEHNFSYKVEHTTLRDSLQLSKVKVLWTDLDGSSYSSASLEQDNGSYFDILDIESYEQNRQGDPTLRLHVRFDCWVGTDADSKHLQQVEGFLAVSYPR